MKFVGLIVFIIFISSCQSEKAKIVIKPTVSFMSQAEVKESFANAYGQRAAPEILNEHAQNRIGNIIPHGTFFTPKQMSKRRVKKTQYAAKGYADLRQFDSPVENQWNGTCTAHGLRNVIDNKGRTTVSTRHIWSGYKVYSCEAAINAWLNKGCITHNMYWPHGFANPLAAYLDNDNCTIHLTDVTYIEDDLDKMRESLDKGNPVYIGMTVTNSMLNCDKVLAPTSRAQSGGHALAIVGYKDDNNIKGGGYFIVKNSWGADCGDHGYQYIPYYHCKRKDMYCIMWSINSIGKATPLILPPNPEEPEQECIRWKRVWFKPWKKKCIEWEPVVRTIAVD
mgnify:CR=1 FL=1